MVGWDDRIVAQSGAPRLCATICFCDFLSLKNYEPIVTHDSSILRK